MVAAVNDLMFASRIRGAAEHTQATVRFVRSEADLLDAARTAALVLLDLETRWLDAPRVIQLLRADMASAAQVVAFAPHVNTEALTAARDAGADRVLARSAFVRLLPDLLGS